MHKKELIVNLEFYEHVHLTDDEEWFHKELDDCC